MLKRKPELLRRARRRRAAPRPPCWPRCPWRRGEVWTEREVCCRCFHSGATKSGCNSALLPFRHHRPTIQHPSSTEHAHWQPGTEGRTRERADAMAGGAEASGSYVRVRGGVARTPRLCSTWLSKKSATIYSRLSLMYWWSSMIITGPTFCCFNFFNFYHFSLKSTILVVFFFNPDTKPKYWLNNKMKFWSVIKCHIYDEF